MILRNGALLLSGSVLLTAAVALLPATALAQGGAKNGAQVIIDPFPNNVQDKIYSKPIQVRDITPADIVGETYFKPTETLVTRKVKELHGDLAKLQGDVVGISGGLTNLERASEGKAAEYYANIATINTQLQNGTTPGNPRLVGKLTVAERNLKELGNTVGQLNELAVDTAQTASEASFLLENTRAAYSLSGAVEEDHISLAKLEDSINNTLVIIERVLNNVNDDITRTTAYLGSERHNMRTLSLAVTNGDLYGKSLSNRPFSSVTPFDPANSAAGIPVASAGALTPIPGAAPAPPLTQARPLVKIRFDRPNVDYEQPIYMAVNEALERYPNAKFELVAVNPTQGNAAQVAIESTRARRNAERVLRTLTQMGLGLERIDLSYTDNPEAASNEVHLYIR